MTDKKILADLNNPTIPRIFDLIIGRVFKKVYLRLGEKEKKDMEMIFLSSNDKDKEKFIEKHIPDFGKLFAKEAKNIKKELELELQ